MPKIHDYECNVCVRSFEFLHMGSEPATCPRCDSTDCEIQLTGGHVFGTIVATSLTSKRYKAGYVHNYVNRPAEKTYISVPAKKEA